MGYAGRSLTQARLNAQANADYFGWPYVVFSDTNSNLRIERYDHTLTCHREGEIIYPQQEKPAPNSGQ